MTDQASQARENAICLEVLKDGLQQKQNGEWTLRLTVKTVEIDHRLVRALMGSRYECVLVEKNDDETPVDHKAIDRDKWRDLGPAKQAGMRCKEPVFWAFLTEEYGSPKIASEDAAAVLVRDLCGVASRADLGKPGQHEARIRWYELDQQYQAWKARENA